MYKVMKNESDLDDWIKLVPNEASVIYSQIAIKNHLKGVLRTFDTSYGINRRIEGDLGGFAIVLFGDALEVLGHERKVLEYFKLNADEYEFEDIYEQKESQLLGANNLMSLLKCFICNFSFIEEPPCN